MLNSFQTGVLRRSNLSLGLLLLCCVFAALPRAGRAQAPANLVANPDFESAGVWNVCGGAAIVDAQTSGPSAAHAGRYAAQFRGPSSGAGCPAPPSGYDYLGKAPQAVWQNVAIPADAPAVTVSFWYWVDGEPQTDLQVFLASNMYSFTNSLVGADLEDLSGFAIPGWTLYRRVLKPAELAAVRGKTLLMAFRLNKALAANDTLTFRVDDVQVVAADARSAAVALPAALRGNGTRPIAYVRSDPGNSFTGRLFRMDSDGQNAGLVYRGQLSDVGAPVWSRGGTQIALIDGNTYPPGEVDVNKYVSATALTVVNADGSSPRTLAQTGGKPGSPCPVPPGDNEIKDLIVEFTHLSWAPDDRSIVASNFSYLRSCSATLSGGLAQIESIATATGAGTKLLDYATTPELSRDGRILFEAYDLQGGNRPGSVWLYDAAAAQQLLAGKGFDDDGDPTWLPDGRRFATIRTATLSYRYDADGSSGTRNQAIMLFDRQDLLNPRMLLLADHGSIDDLAASPDGAYLLYTLRTTEGNVSRSNIWWLDVAGGTTGPVTTDGLSRDPDWRFTAVSPSGPSALPRRASIPFAAK